MSSATTFSVDSEVTHCDFGDTFKERRKSCRHGLPRPETQTFNDVAVFLEDLPRLQPICENQTGEESEAISSLASKKVMSSLPNEEQHTKRSKMRINLANTSKVLCGVIKFIKAFTFFLNPPLIASVLSIVIACIPPLQHWLSGVKLLRNTLNWAGNASIPITLIVLGSFFSSNTRKSVDSIEPASDFAPSSHSSSENETTTIALSLITRHLITPLILLPLMYILSNFTSVTIFADPIFLLTTALLVGAPPAITLSQMTTGKDESLDKLLSRLLFCSFVFFTPLTTLLLVGISLMMHDKH